VGGKQQQIMKRIERLESATREPAAIEASAERLAKHWGIDLGSAPEMRSFIEQALRDGEFDGPGMTWELFSALYNASQAHPLQVESPRLVPQPGGGFSVEE